MGKKKKKSISILNEVDKTIKGTYEDLTKEISEMQTRLYLADQEAIKKAKKEAKKNKKGKKEIYDTDKIRCKVRKELITEMEGSNFLERAMQFLQDLSPIFVIIARLIASLILCILSIDRVKVLIKPETLKKLGKVVEKALSYC